MRRLLGVIIVAMVMLVPAGVVGPVGAVVPGSNGRVLYTRMIYRSTLHFQLEAADPDGTNVTVLATVPQDAFGELFANWSPDGSTVVFSLNDGIWEVNADGSDLHELISCSSLGVHCGADGGFGQASFTPDGTHIVTGHCCTDGDGLYILNADGTGFRVIRADRHHGAGFGNPQVSPDGTTIAFSRCPNDTPGCLVGTMSMNGGKLRMLTDGSTNWDFPNWSPDSKRIVFSGFGPDDASANIAIMSADGTGFRQLTPNTNGTFSVWACFSPDGSKILYSHDPSTGWWDLYTMNPDGSGAAPVARTADAELWPQWAAVG